LILRDEHRPKVYENTELRRIFGLQRDEIIGGLSTLHNEELHNVCSLPNIIRIIMSGVKWVGHVACRGEKRKAYRVLVGKPEVKRERTVNPCNVSGICRREELVFMQVP
jgi:hypothetical protein